MWSSKGKKPKKGEADRLGITDSSIEQASDQKVESEQSIPGVIEKKKEQSVFSRLSLPKNPVAKVKKKDSVSSLKSYRIHSQTSSPFGSSTQVDKLSVFQRENYETKFDELSEEKANLERENQELEKKNRSLNNQIKKVDEEREKLTIQIEKVDEEREKEEERTEKIKNLAKSNAELLKKIDELEKQLAARRKEEEKYQETEDKNAELVKFRRQSLTINNASLSSSISEQESRITNLQKDYEEVVARNEELERQAFELKEYIERIGTEKTDQPNLGEEVELEHYRETNKNLEKENQKLGKRLKQLKKDWESSQRKLIVLKEDNEKLKDKLDEQVILIGTLRNQLLEKTSISLENKAERLLNTENQLEKTAEENTNLKAENQSLNEKLDNLNEGLQKLTTFLEEKLKVNSPTELEVKLNGYHDLDEFLAELVIVKEARSKVEGELIAEQSKNAILNNQLKDLENERDNQEKQTLKKIIQELELGNLVKEPALQQVITEIKELLKKSDHSLSEPTENEEVVTLKSELAQTQEKNIELEAEIRKIYQAQAKAEEVKEDFENEARKLKGYSERLGDLNSSVDKLSISNAGLVAKNHRKGKSRNSEEVNTITNDSGYSSPESNSDNEELKKTKRQLKMTEKTLTFKLNKEIRTREKFEKDLQERISKLENYNSDFENFNNLFTETKERVIILEKEIEELKKNKPGNSTDQKNVLPEKVMRAENIILPIENNKLRINCPEQEKLMEKTEAFIIYNK